MKQSTFKKQFTATGEYGTVTAEIVATMNYTVVERKGTHAYTHDEWAKTIPLHKVEAFINGKSWKLVDELESELYVLTESRSMVAKVQEEIQLRSNKKPTMSFTEQMNQLFY